MILQFLVVSYLMCSTLFGMDRNYSYITLSYIAHDYSTKHKLNVFTEPEKKLISSTNFEYPINTYKIDTQKSLLIVTLENGEIHEIKIKKLF